MKLVEADLEFEINGSIRAVKFDDENVHGLTHCMKAVDFVVEYEKKIFLIEVKDPQHPRSLTRNTNDFKTMLYSNELIVNVLVPKCRDSFLYEFAFKRTNKEVFYLVLVALDTLSAADLNNLTDNLKKQLPVDGPRNNPWPNKFISGCLVLNLSAWNSNFNNMQVKRLSIGP